MTVSRGTDYNSHKKQNSRTLIPWFWCVCVCLRRGEREGGEGGAEREVNEEVGKGRGEEGDYVHFGLILLSILCLICFGHHGAQKKNTRF